MIAFLLIGAALSTTIVVDASGMGDAITIADGAALLSDGDTLEIGPGAYPATWVDLRALTGLTIRGGGVGTTFVGAEEVGMATFLLGGGTTLEDISFENWDDCYGVVEISNGDGTANLIRACSFEEHGLNLLSSDATTVESCTFIGIWALIYDQKADYHFENNLFLGFEYGIWQGWGLHYYGSIEVVNNTFVGNVVGVRIDEGGDWAYTLIVNNIFADGTHAWIVENSFFGADEIAFNVIGTDITDGSWTTGDPALTDIHDNLEADPLFVDHSDDGDWSNDDFHLSPTSPAIDFGANG